MTYLTVPFFTYVFSILPVWPLWLATNLAAMYLLLFRERFDPRTFVFWVAIVFVLPFLGFLLYLGWGSTIALRRDGARKESEDRRFMQGESDDVPEPCRRMASAMSSSGADICTGGNSAYLLWRADEAFQSMMRDISGAARSVHLVLVRLPAGDHGRRFVDVLCRKAAEGVDIRIITDRLGFGRTHGLHRLKAAGVRHSTFHSPIHAAFSLKPVNRCLREICAIDGRLSYCGMGSYVRIEGPASERLDRRFMADWAHASGEDVSVPEALHAECAGDCNVQAVQSGPDSQGMPMLNGFSEMIAGARKTLYMAFPYLVPEDEAYSAIKQAVIAGTDVRILIPMECSHWYQRWNTLSAANPLIEAGVHVYFSRKATVRSIAVADGRICVVGSGLYNTRSMWADYGENVVVYSEALSAEAVGRFMDDFEGAVECEPDEYRRRSFMDKLRICIARLFMFLNRCGLSFSIPL